jgi:hypothetical protein
MKEEFRTVFDVAPGGRPRPLRLLLDLRRIPLSLVTEHPEIIRLLRLSGSPYLRLAVEPKLDEICQLAASYSAQISASEGWVDYVVEPHSAAVPNSTDVVVSPQEAIGRFRLLMVNNGIFEVVPGFSLNEGLYYLYRTRSLFPAGDLAWSTAVYGSKNGMLEKVFEQLNSLGHRISFLCRAEDRGCYFALKSPNNDTEANILYHLGYFVMLATGMFRRFGLDDRTLLRTRP